MTSSIYICRGQVNSWGHKFLCEQSGIISTQIASFCSAVPGIIYVKKEDVSPFIDRVLFYQYLTLDV